MSESWSLPVVEGPVYVDIDQKYDYTTEPAQLAILRGRAEWLAGRGWPILSLWIRPSSDKNTHLSLILKRPITLGDSFVARAVMGDDPFRLACDLVRIARGDRVNRIFDEKFVWTGRGKCWSGMVGPWSQIATFKEHDGSIIEG